MISHRKFVLELLEEYDILGSKPITFLVEINAKLTHVDPELLTDPIVYRKTVGKLMYITLTRPNISYGVHISLQFLDKPAQIHLDAAFKILKYLKNAPG